MSKRSGTSSTGRTYRSASSAAAGSTSSEAEALLRLPAGDRLQLALEAGRLGDWLWDARTGQVSLGDRAAALFGLAAATSLPLHALRERLVEADVLLDAAVVARALSSRSDYEVEFRVRRSSGEIWWLAARGRAVHDSSGTLLGMTGVVQDVTARKLADEVRARFAAIVESSDDAIISKTLTGVIVTWNPGAERMFGYGSDEVIGRSITLLIPPDHLDEEPAILDRLKRGERIAHYETVRVRKDGTRLDISLSVSPIRGGDGTIIGASKIARDISRQKRAEEALRTTDRRKDEFLATLAHELRNPLAPIRQATAISQARDATDAQKRWSHDVISRQVEHMSLLLDDLLDISRITRGTLELRPEPTELCAIIDAAVETARPVIDAKQHRLVLEIPAEPLHFVADPLRLAQVLSNLLTNAAKYTDPRGEIRLAATHTRDSLVLRVRDSGIGITPDALDEVFRMFSQVKSGPDRSEGGLGIGLALAKGLVELHGGTIAAASRGRGRGSEFTVRLPLQLASAAQEPDAANGSTRTATRRRVLIADDNRDAAESLAILLRMDGHEVTLVHDGQDALQSILAASPDVAILDIGMPKLDGYEVARRARLELPGPLKLIALTGWGQASDKSRALAAGFDHHFTKPVEPNELRGLLR